MLLCCTLLIGAGCGTSPPERFFTLESTPPQQRSSSTGTEFTVVVGPITIPELVDRPQLVLRTAPGRVEVVEQARWAAPLKSEIPRVVADHLARFLESARTATSAERAVGTPDYRVLIDIQRFESTPQQGVTLQAAWTVRTPAGASSGRSLLTEPAGGGYDELVAAHSRALATLSREIATSIESARAQKR
jgi:uncharacterized lipoprotein YmbA